MTQREQVLAMLHQGPCTTGDFLSARLPRFSARIEELRKEGYRIDSGRVREGEWVYQLVAVPFDVTAAQRALHDGRPKEVFRGGRADGSQLMERLFTPPAIGHHHYDQER